MPPTISFIIKKATQFPNAFFFSYVCRQSLNSCPMLWQFQRSTCRLHSYLYFRFWKNYNSCYGDNYFALVLIYGSHVFHSYLALNSYYYLCSICAFFANIQLLYVQYYECRVAYMISYELWAVQIIIDNYSVKLQLVSLYTFTQSL